ncbi:hypothetical protein H0X48_02610 [Candidatus Dependentiae bacterium]|nr:hypothetical protein [Candidatus Dependentiae bacterium]
MKVRFYTFFSVLVGASTIYGCPMCKDVLGNVDKPFFHEDAKGRKLDKKTAAILSRVHKYIEKKTQEKPKESIS